MQRDPAIADIPCRHDGKQAVEFVSYRGPRTAGVVWPDAGSEPSGVPAIGSPKPKRMGPGGSCVQVKANAHAAHPNRR